MQPNVPNNPYSRAGVPNGGQPLPSSQNPPQMVQQGVPVPPPRRATMNPGSAIPPVGPNEIQTTAHKKTVLADGTVLPDVIYVKKKGALVGFIITSILLVACAIYAVIMTIQATGSKPKTDDLRAENNSLRDKLEEIRYALGYTTVDDLTTENLKKLVSNPEGAVDIDLSSFNDGDGTNINSIRISSNKRYALADVTIDGVKSYYYREIDVGSWNLAFTRASVVNCREITLDAMRIVDELGGVEKSIDDSGAQYDCLDPSDDDKLYSFSDAISAGIYKE